MNAIIFDDESLEAWASFSGDRNPIHFDAEIAQQLLGTDGTIAHGMLAMFPLKRQIATLIADEPPAPAWRWEALLRRPVLCSGTYNVRSHRRATGDAVSVNLETAADATRAITSRLAPCSWQDGDARTMLHTLTPSEVSFRYRHFRDAFPELNAPWIFYDALLFACYLDRHLADMLDDLGFPLREPREVVSQDIAVLQIAHAIEANDALLRHGLAPPALRLGYRTAPPIVTGVGDTRYVTVRSTLFEHAEPLLTQEISLAIRHRTASHTH